MPSITPSFVTWPTHEDALERAVESGALGDIEAALRAAYDVTATSPGGRLKPSGTVEVGLKDTGWKKVRVWAPEEFGLATRDSFDAWKVFKDGAGNRFGVAVEVEWVWERLYADLLKFWGAARGGQAALGVEVLYGPDSLDYVVHHQFALYRELFPELRVVFCALDAPDLLEPRRFVHHRLKHTQKTPYELP
jgi:hypothetical protein